MGEKRPCVSQREHGAEHQCWRKHCHERFITGFLVQGLWRVWQCWMRPLEPEPRRSQPGTNLASPLGSAGAALSSPDDMGSKKGGIKSLGKEKRLAGLGRGGCKPCDPPADPSPPGTARGHLLAAGTWGTARPWGFSTSTAHTCICLARRQHFHIFKYLIFAAWLPWEPARRKLDSGSVGRVLPAGVRERRVPCGQGLALPLGRSMGISISAPDVLSPKSREIPLPDTLMIPI